ncbi:hypothetical protein [Cellulomonas sp.]|uniref:hypothetical protein n=1 Tax=Cellulomonas sp. TaxID=40001 RepID=UPI003BA8BC3C
MSRWVLSSTEIDLIVHVVVHGPDGVELWGSPQAIDPDVLGSALWARNWEIAADDEAGPMPEYRFRPPGVRLTALEGLRLLAYYTYQSDDDDHRWRRGGLGAIVDSVTQGLISVLPGMAELPWSWSRSDLDARRVDPPESARPDPRIAELAQRYADAGIALKEWIGKPLPFHLGSDVPVVAWWSYHPPGHSRIPALSVFLADDDAAAELLVRMVRSQFTGVRADRTQGMLRRGREVVALDWVDASGTSRGDELWERVAALGTVDERWHSDDAPQYQSGGEVLARRVDVHPDRVSNNGGFLVARTRADLAALADEISDPEVRERILQVDAARQSVILLPTLPDVESVTAVRLDDHVLGTRGYETASTLSIHVHGARRQLMSVIAVDRLPRVPAQAAILEDGVPVIGHSVRGVRDRR